MEGYMLFFREKDYQHYLFNGTDVIAINPHNKVKWSDDTDGGFTDDEGFSILNQAFHSKARGFKIGKIVRYQIIHRGHFISE